MGYDHTQRGGLHWILVAAAVLCGVGAVATRAAGWPAWVLAGSAVLVLFLALCFRTLRVRDEGDALGVRFGPIPLFRHRIPYSAMARATAGRSRWIDGWGVHWVPGRGWTWNLWGFDCVEITLVHGKIRIGTDDRQGLAAFLDTRIGESPGAS